jgi:hypothetical protein
MKDLTNLLIKIYEGRFDREEGESDEDYLTRVANQDMMVGSRQYMAQGKVGDYRKEQYNVDNGTEEGECIQGDGESDEDFLNRCANRDFTPSTRLFRKTPSKSVSKPLVLKPKP